MDSSLSNLRELVMDKQACSPWGLKESDMAGRLNWTELSKLIYRFQNIPIRIPAGFFTETEKLILT